MRSVSGRDRLSESGGGVCLRCCRVRKDAALDRASANSAEAAMPATRPRRRQKDGSRASVGRACSGGLDARNLPDVPRPARGGGAGPRQCWQTGRLAAPAPRPLDAAARRARSQHRPVPRVCVGSMPRPAPTITRSRGLWKRPRPSPHRSEGLALAVACKSPARRQPMNPVHG